MYKHIITAKHCTCIKNLYLIYKHGENNLHGVYLENYPKHCRLNEACDCNSQFLNS